MAKRREACSRSWAGERSQSAERPPQQQFTIPCSLGGTYRSPWWSMLNTFPGTLTVCVALCARSSQLLSTLSQPPVTSMLWPATYSTQRTVSSCVPITVSVPRLKSSLQRQGIENVLRNKQKKNDARAKQCKQRAHSQ